MRRLRRRHVVYRRLQPRPIEEGAFDHHSEGSSGVRAVRQGLIVPEISIPLYEYSYRIEYRIPWAQLRELSPTPREVVALLWRQALL